MYFHVCNSYSFDIMLDLLEGVVQYEIKLLFGNLTHHFVSEQGLLSRIYGFDYGFLERKNRPTKIILDSAGNCWEKCGLVDGWIGGTETEKGWTMSA